jgi:predicted double-glycine peptidase
MYYKHTAPCNIKDEKYKTETECWQLVKKNSTTDNIFILFHNVQDITQSDVAVADTEYTEVAYKNEILRYIQQKWCR